MDKSYTTTARFGFVSDTLDAEGEPVPVDGPIPNTEEIRQKLPLFTGPIRQVPPMASAVKVGGRRLYELHRRGVEVEREPRPVDIHAFGLLSADPENGTATFEISCSSGTYVRTLISDLARSLGSGAYVSALRRTRVGHLRVSEASRPEDLDENTIGHRIIHPTDVLRGLPGVEVAEEVRAAVCNGRKMRAFGVAGPYRVMNGEEVLAVYRDEGPEARAEVVLCAP
jgi:tRNA pseudouridine55 synthase